jgi:hypothetical protein
MNLQHFSRRQVKSDFVFRISEQFHKAESPYGPNHILKFDTSNKGLIEDLLNSTYNVLDKELQSQGFDLSTDEGINRAWKYIGENFNELNKKIDLQL